MPITGAEAGNVHGVNRGVWSVPGELLAPGALLKNLGRSFALEPGYAGPVISNTWFDTFDWRLHRRSQLLSHDGAAWNLAGSGPGSSVSQAGAAPPAGALLSRDLPPGRLRSVLEPILEMRSLLPVFSEELHSARYSIKNKDAKTVATIALEEHRFTQTGTVYRTVLLEGVRGYSGQYGKVRRFLSQYGLREEAGPFPFFAEGVKSLGRQPLDYSSGFTLDLQPEMTAFQAMTAVYRQLLGTMRQNESGIVADLDPEFLHDFRVAVRRTRSGLGQVRMVLPPSVTADFKAKFSWLGAITGPTRDLDVYLLYEDNYRARLPASLHTGLQPFFAEVRARRAAARKQLVRHLGSKKYRSVLASWDSYLRGESPNGAGDNAMQPIAELSAGIIWRKYRSIIKGGRAIRPSSPDEDLHRLRIQCKKLRYILEFFASLYPVDDIALMIRQLKRLQTNLGDLNDLSVQQDMLRNYLASVRPGSRKNQETAASLGGLLTNLYHEHRRVRKDFGKRFQEFSRPENGSLYRKLFGPDRLSPIREQQVDK